MKQLKEKATVPPRFVVLMAASVGGIRAMAAILRALPADLPASLVVVEHRRKTAAESVLVSILARSSALPVTDAGR